MPRIRARRPQALEAPFHDRLAGKVRSVHKGARPLIIPQTISRYRSFSLPFFGLCKLRQGSIGIGPTCRELLIAFRRFHFVTRRGLSTSDAQIRKAAVRAVL